MCETNSPLGWGHNYNGGLWSDGNQIAGNIVTIDVSLTDAGVAAGFRFSPDFANYQPMGGYALYNGRHHNWAIQMQQTRPEDYQEANDAAGLAQQPPGFTWHHLYNTAGQYVLGCTMQLVNTVIHQKSTPHRGGRWQYDHNPNRPRHLNLAKRESFYLAPPEVPAFLTEYRSSEAFQEFPKKQFIYRDGAPLFSLVQFFTEQTGRENAGYTGQYPGLTPLGLDGGGNILAFDDTQDVFLLDHESADIEETGFTLRQVLDELG